MRLPRIEIWGDREVGYRITVHAGNGARLAQSDRKYRTIPAAKRAVYALIRAVAKGELTIRDDIWGTFAAQEKP